MTYLQCGPAVYNSNQPIGNLHFTLPPDLGNNSPPCSGVRVEAEGGASFVFAPLI
jgi:hypothetical protein